MLPQYETHVKCGVFFPLIMEKNMSRMLDSCIITTTITSPNITGNIVPHSWYTQITSDSGKPDHNAISIFSEIVYWYRPNREGRSKFVGDAWQTSYKHFEKRFSYNSELIRRTLVRLEKLGLARREFRTIEKYGQKYSNVLFIRLLVDIASDGSIIRNNYYTNNVCPEMNSGELILSSFSSLDDKTTSSEYSQNICLDEIVDSDSKKTQKILLPLHEFTTPSPQICGQHYIDKENKLENKENRSDLHASVPSIFSFSSLDEGKELRNNEQEQNFGLNEMVNLSTEKNKNNIFSSISDKTKKFLHKFGSRSKPLDWKEGRALSELSGISEEDKDILNQRSGRQFSINFIDQLVLKLGIKCSEHKFYRKEQFMNYMVKALSNEILQAPQANNEDFKFTCLPRTEEETYQKRVNKYLEDIESSIDTTLEMRLKKKILGKLEPRLAYEIISGTSLSVVESTTNDIEHIKSENTEILEQQEQEIPQTLHIKILRSLRLNSFMHESITEIPDWIKQILLEEARGIYGQSVHCYNVVMDIKFRNEFSKSFKSSKSPKGHFYKNFDEEQTELPELNYYPETENYLDTEKNKNKNKNSVWNHVLGRLEEIYGVGTYKSWFSKLNILDKDVEIDTMEAKAKTALKIQTQTGFVRDWVRTNYGSAIEKVLRGFCPNLQYVEFV